MKKGIIIFCGVCVLVFMAFTVKCAVDFAEKAEQEAKKEVAQIKKEIEELRKSRNVVPIKRLLYKYNKGLEEWSYGIKKIIQEIERKYGGRIKLVAKKYNINQKVIIAIIAVESSGNCCAVSPAGAKGLMQLMPKTAKIMGVKDPFHQYENILAGVNYLKYLQKRFGDFDTALAAYNLGPTKVAKLLENDFNPSAYKYVRKVKAVMKEV